jgi:RHS repeat-associated protein
VGYRWEPDTELYDIRRRKYSATRGRWQSRDPLRVLLTEQNSYLYANNQPITHIDPTGYIHDCCGLDITSPLKETLKKIRSEFGSWSSSTKESRCKGLWGIQAAFWWDIIELAVLPSRYIGPIGIDPTGCDFYDKLCNQKGVCKFTVTIDKGCYSCQSANYIAVGLMWKLCHDFFGGYAEYDMLFLLGIWRGIIFGAQSRANWAIAGYEGWPSSPSPDPDKKYCCLCPHAASQNVFHVMWGGPNNVF